MSMVMTMNDGTALQKTDVHIQLPVQKGGMIAYGDNTKMSLHSSLGVNYRKALHENEWEKKLSCFCDHM